MDNTILVVVLTGLSTVAAVAGVMYSFLRNFKADVVARFDKIDKDFHEMDKRVYTSNQRMDGVYNVILKRMEEGGK